MTNLKQLILLLTLALALFSCTKEGPQGPAGENGSNGKDGTSGSNGKDGNANVLSGTIVLDNNRFVRDFWSIRLNNVILSSPAKSAAISLPAITHNIYQTGTVLVYMKMPSGTTGASWIPLPFSRPGSNPGGYLIVTNYMYEPGTLRIYYYHQLTDNALAGSMPIASDAAVPTQEYKYVIIAGNAAANAVAKPPVDFSNYEEVKAYFKLIDLPSRDLPSRVY